MIPVDVATSMDWTEFDVIMLPSGSYGYSFEGFILCYTLAIPFFAQTLVSTFIFSGILEAFYKLKFLEKFYSKTIN